MTFYMFLSRGIGFHYFLSSNLRQFVFEDGKSHKSSKYDSIEKWVNSFDGKLWYLQEIDLEIKDLEKLIKEKGIGYIIETYIPKELLL
jgi:hypothetical protein